MRRALKIFAPVVRQIAYRRHFVHAAAAGGGKMGPRTRTGWYGCLHRGARGARLPGTSWMDPLQLLI